MPVGFGENDSGTRSGRTVRYTAVMVLLVPRGTSTGQEAVVLQLVHSMKVLPGRIGAVRVVEMCLEEVREYEVWQREMQQGR